MKRRPGNCYKAAADLLDQWRFSGELDKLGDRAVFVVHAEVYHPKLGWHGHAWVERDDDLSATVHLFEGYLMPFPARVRNVYDFSNNQQTVLPAVLYYYLGKVRKPRYYTPEQVLAMLDKHETFGPWK